MDLEELEVDDDDDLRADEEIVGHNNEDEQAEDEIGTPVVTMFQKRKMRNGGQFGYFTRTGGGEFDGPTLQDTLEKNPQAGDLYVYRKDADAPLCAWIFGNGAWEEAEEGTAHPTLGQYKLHFQKDVVRWVQAKSLQTYSYRKRPN